MATLNFVVTVFLAAHLSPASAFYRAVPCQGRLYEDYTGVDFRDGFQSDPQSTSEPDTRYYKPTVMTDEPHFDFSQEGQVTLSGILYKTPLITQGTVENPTSEHQPVQTFGATHVFSVDAFNTSCDVRISETSDTMNTSNPLVNTIASWTLHTAGCVESKCASNCTPTTQRLGLFCNPGEHNYNGTRTPLQLREWCNHFANKMEHWSGTETNAILLNFTQTASASDMRFTPPRVTNTTSQIALKYWASLQSLLTYTFGGASDPNLGHFINDAIPKAIWRPKDSSLFQFQDSAQLTRCVRPGISRSTRMTDICVKDISPSYPVIRVLNESIPAIYSLPHLLCPTFISDLKGNSIGATLDFAKNDEYDTVYNTMDKRPFTVDISYTTNNSLVFLTPTILQLAEGFSEASTHYDVGGRVETQCMRDTIDCRTSAYYDFREFVFPTAYKTYKSSTITKCYFWVTVTPPVVRSNIERASWPVTFSANVTIDFSDSECGWFSDDNTMLGHRGLKWLRFARSNLQSLSRNATLYADLYRGKVYLDVHPVRAESTRQRLSTTRWGLVSKTRLATTSRAAIKLPDWDSNLDPAPHDSQHVHPYHSFYDHMFMYVRRFGTQRETGLVACYALDVPAVVDKPYHLSFTIKRVHGVSMQYEFHCYDHREIELLRSKSGTVQQHVDLEDDDSEGLFEFLPEVQLYTLIFICGDTEVQREYLTLSLKLDWTTWYLFFTSGSRLAKTFYYNYAFGLERVFLLILFFISWKYNIRIAAGLSALAFLGLHLPVPPGAFATPAPTDPPPVGNHTNLHTPISADGCLSNVCTYTENVNFVGRTDSPVTVTLYDESGRSFGFEVGVRVLSRTSTIGIAYAYGIPTVRADCHAYFNSDLSRGTYVFQDGFANIAGHAPYCAADAYRHATHGGWCPIWIGTSDYTCHTSPLGDAVDFTAHTYGWSGVTNVHGHVNTRTSRLAMACWAIQTGVFGTVFKVTQVTESVTLELSVKDLSNDQVVSRTASLISDTSEFRLVHSTIGTIQFLFTGLTNTLNFPLRVGQNFLLKGSSIYWGNIPDRYDAGGVGKFRVFQGELVEGPETRIIHFPDPLEEGSTAYCGCTMYAVDTNWMTLNLDQIDDCQNLPTYVHFDDGTSVFHDRSTYQQIRYPQWVQDPPTSGQTGSVTFSAADPATYFGTIQMRGVHLRQRLVPMTNFECHLGTASWITVECYLCNAQNTVGFSCTYHGDGGTITVSTSGLFSTTSQDFTCGSSPCKLRIRVYPNGQRGLARVTIVYSGESYSEQFSSDLTLRGPDDTVETGGSITGVNTTFSAYVDQHADHSKAYRAGDGFLDGLKEAFSQTTKRLSSLLPWNWSWGSMLQMVVVGGLMILALVFFFPDIKNLVIWIITHTVFAPLQILKLTTAAARAVFIPSTSRQLKRLQKSKTPRVNLTTRGFRKVYNSFAGLWRTKDGRGADFASIDAKYTLPRNADGTVNKKAKASYSDVRSRQIKKQLLDDYKHEFHALTPEERERAIEILSKQRDFKATKADGSPKTDATLMHRRRQQQLAGKRLVGGFKEDITRRTLGNNTFTHQQPGEDEESKKDRIAVNRVIAQQRLRSQGYELTFEDLPDGKVKTTTRPLNSERKERPTRSRRNERRQPQRETEGRDPTPGSKRQRARTQKKNSDKKASKKSSAPESDRPAKPVADAVTP